ncbi:uncharacterized protein WM277_012532 isoform 1-T1 [Molossus nigricans]
MFTFSQGHCSFSCQFSLTQLHFLRHSWLTVAIGTLRCLPPAPGCCLFKEGAVDFTPARPALCRAGHRVVPRCSRPLPQRDLTALGTLLHVRFGVGPRTRAALNLRRQRCAHHRAPMGGRTLEITSFR